MLSVRRAVLALPFVLSATPGLAQEETADTVPVAPPAAEPSPAPPAEAEPAGPTLGQIIVTAERKTASLQDTPISIAVFDSEKLEDRGISGVDTLTGNVPSMTIDPFPTHNATLRIFIRGVGTADAQITQDPAVGIYIDGVYIARSVGLAIDTADLQRIEVLRGPQGTLYGRNTTGGAVNLVTQRPQMDDFSMTHDATIGERNEYKLKSAVNVPVADNLAAKLAVIAATKDGFVENKGPGGDFGDKRQFGVRFDARWVAADWLTADYSYDYTDLHYYNNTFQAITPPFTNHGLAETFKPYAQSQTVYSSDRLKSLETGTPMRASGSKIQGHALTLDMPLSTFELKYILAYRELSDDEYQDLGGGAGSLDYRLDTNSWDGPSATVVYGGPTPSLVPRVTQHQVSNELQLSGNFFDETLETIVGAYAFEERGGEDGSPIHHILNSKLEPAQAASLFALAPDLAQQVIQLASPSLVAYWDYRYGIHNTAYALFSQATWSPDFFGRRLHATLGLRQSWDGRVARKDYIQREFVEGDTPLGNAGAIEVPSIAQQGNDIFVGARGERHDSDFSPSANLRYDVTDEMGVYFSYARAYKSGGFNVRDPQISGASGAASDGTNYGFGFEEGFAPEIVQSYELGVKSEWLGHRLRFNADVFDSEYHDMQTNFLIAGTISDTKARNVGKARMQGFEMETMFAATSNLLLSLDYSYLHAKVLEVIDIDGNNIAKFYPFVSAPPHSGTASIDWSILTASWGSLRGSANYNYIGRRIGTVIVEERRGLEHIASYGTLNLRLAASDIRIGAHGGLEVALWCRNAFDKEYTIFAISNTPQADRSVLWGEPRAIGMDLVYRWE